MTHVLVFSSYYYTVLPYMEMKGPYLSTVRPLAVSIPGTIAMYDESEEDNGNYSVYISTLLLKLSLK